jgi:hypothetical protein
VKKGEKKAESEEGTKWGAERVHKMEAGGLLFPPAANDNRTLHVTWAHTVIPHSSRPINIPHITKVAVLSRQEFSE